MEFRSELRLQLLYLKRHNLDIVWGRGSHFAHVMCLSHIIADVRIVAELITTQSRKTFIAQQAWAL
jgi:hypothetical protein